MTAAQADLQPQFLEMPEGLRIDSPRVADGATLWRIARDAGSLDVNSSYSYLLWCRDFAGTSVVARGPEGAPVGFVTGYLRPEQPTTLLVWQVAVDQRYRGRGLAAALLDGLLAKVSAERDVTGLETTITPGNTASERLFRSFASRHSAPLERKVLFPAGVFPEGAEHDPEVLYRIGPFDS